MNIDQVVATKMEKYFTRELVIADRDMYKLFSACYGDYYRRSETPIIKSEITFHINDTGLIEIIFSVINDVMPMVKDIVITDKDVYKARPIDRRYLDITTLNVIFDDYGYEHRGCIMPDKLEEPVRVINKFEKKGYTRTDYAIPAIFFAASQLDWTVDEVHDLLSSETDLYTPSELDLIKKLLTENNFIGDDILLFIRLNY